MSDSMMNDVVGHEQPSLPSPSLPSSVLSAGSLPYWAYGLWALAHAAQAWRGHSTPLIQCRLAVHSAARVLEATSYL